MLKKLYVTAFCLLSGCSQISGGGLDIGNAVGSGADLYKAASLSDKDVQSMALQFAKESDKLNPVSTTSAKYGKRLSKLTAPYSKYDGLNLKFKAYEVVDVNAFSLADGNVRVFAGLMDIMNDDELLFVIGHEIGHIKNGHSKEKTRLAYAASAARKGVAASNSTAGSLAASEVGGLLEAVVNSQFSQSEERESDDYGLKFLKSTKRNTKAAASALRKIAKATEGKHSMLSSHPDPEDRAQRMEKDA